MNEQTSRATFRECGTGKNKILGSMLGANPPPFSQSQTPAVFFLEDAPKSLPTHTTPPPPFFFFPSLHRYVIFRLCRGFLAFNRFARPPSRSQPHPFFFTLEKSNEHHTCTPHAPLHRTNGEAHRDLPPASPQFYPSDRRVPRYSRTGIAARGPLTRSFALWRVSGTRAGPTSLTS